MNFYETTIFNYLLEVPIFYSVTETCLATSWVKTAENLKQVFQEAISLDTSSMYTSELLNHIYNHEIDWVKIAIRLFQED